MQKHWYTIIYCTFYIIFPNIVMFSTVHIFIHVFHITHLHNQSQTAMKYRSKKVVLTLLPLWPTYSRRVFNVHISTIGDFSRHNQNVLIQSFIFFFEAYAPILRKLQPVKDQDNGLSKKLNMGSL